jgi:hypothetical protein
MNAWKEYMTAIDRLCTHEFSLKELKSKYKKMVVFIDCNPSFSIYTQMALVSADRLVIPVMADFSSLEGIKGIFMLLYGLYPSVALQQYANPILTFSKQAESFNLTLPIIYEFIFNSFTKYDGKSQKSDGIATAYSSVRKEIIDFCYKQFREQPHLFFSDNNIPTNRDKWTNAFFSDVKDFHSAGKVSSALGIPMFKLPAQSAYTMPDGKQVQLPSSGYQKALENISDLVNKL